MKSRMRKIRKANTWKARPARRMLLAVTGDFRFDWLTPMRAAPAICTMVAITSAVMKMPRIVLFERPKGLNLAAPILLLCPDNAAMNEVRVV